MQAFGWLALMKMSGGRDGDGAQGGAEVDAGRMAAWTGAPRWGRLAKASPDHYPTWRGCVGGGWTAAGVSGRARTDTDRDDGMDGLTG